MSKMKKLLAVLVGLLIINLQAGDTHSITEFGDISTPEAAEKALQAGIEKFAKTGGILTIPANAPKGMKVINRSQLSRNAPGVTIIDYREGFINYDLPQLGKHRTGVWSGIGVNRTLNLRKESISHCGVYSNMGIRNYSVSGCTSYMCILSEPVKKGNDVKCYVENICGIWVGQYLNVTSSMMGYAPPYDRITVKSIGWDKEKRQNYFTCDLKYDHPVGALVYNKHVVNGLQIEDWSNCANQSMTLQVGRRQYSNGDSFVISGHLKYMGNIMSGYGDEMGVVINSETIGELDGFHSTVESVDWSKDEITYAPGKVNSHTLADQRALINMNKKKWITKGKVMIVSPDDWYGMIIKAPGINGLEIARKGIDIAGFPFTFEKDGKKLPGIVNYENLPVKKFKYTYKGKAYPSIIAGPPIKNYLGGCIIGSKDCPWTEDIIGRFFTITDPSEVILPKDGNYGYAQAPKRPAYRWYRIEDFYENPDGTKVLKIMRVRWAATKSGAPILFVDDNYTWDGHERPLDYAIAPGAWVYSVADGWDDSYHRGGHMDKKHSRKICVTPTPDRGTSFDFQPGDPIEQAIGPDPWCPTPIRIRQFDQLPTTGSNGSFDILQLGRVQVPTGINIGGGIGYRSQLAKRKDKKPTFNTLVDLHTLSNVGLRFTSEVLDSAIQFEQPNNYPQPIRWKNDIAKDNLLQVDPKNGEFQLVGSGVKLTGQSVTEQKGISATSTPAGNLRGINVAVTSSAKSLKVKFPTKEADAAYSINVQPNWNTNDWIVKKEADGFTVSFSNPAPATGKIDWQLIR